MRTAHPWTDDEIRRAAIYGLCDDCREPCHPGSSGSAPWCPDCETNQ